MPGIDPQTQFLCKLHPVLDPDQLSLATFPVRRLRKNSGMYFDEVRPNLVGSLDLIGIGIYEQRHRDSCAANPLDCRLDLLHIAADVQPPFSSKLKPLFRNKRTHIGPDLLGNGNHLIGGGHFQIQTSLYCLSQQLKVTVLYMTPVLSQMNRYPVRSCQLRNGSCRYRIRLSPSPSLPDGCNMVYVHSKFRHSISPLC